MGAATRQALEKLRQRYAGNFDIEPSSVDIEEWEDGEGKVWCSERFDLPVWTLNQSERDYFSPE